MAKDQAPRSYIETYLPGLDESSVVARYLKMQRALERIERMGCCCDEIQNIVVSTLRDVEG